MTDPGTLPMWTIYDHPADIPVGFVVRRWETRAGSSEPFKGDVLGVFASLEEARAVVPKHCVCLARDPNDDPHIVETWL